MIAPPVVPVAAVRGRRVRVSPACEFVAVDSLPWPTRRWFIESPSAGRGTAVGLIVGTPDSAVPARVVDRAGATLLASLRRPRPVCSDDESDVFLKLVCDGILEVDCAGRWSSGPRVWESVAVDGGRQRPTSGLGRLSFAAVEYAQHLHLTSARSITARLYCYHRVPLSRRWWRLYPGPETVLRLMGSAVLQKHWRRGASRRATLVDWLTFTRPDVQRGALRYKLYVSPAVSTLGAVLPILGEVLTAAGARHFKVGPDAAGLLRPDKIVVYAEDHAELAAIGKSLSAGLAGVPAHGVPFTAQVDGDGLLSWGLDPGPDAAPLGDGPESWRWSVARRLGEYLRAADRAGLRRFHPAEFALARLRLDGVDIRSFRPSHRSSPAAGQVNRPATVPGGRP